MAKEILDAWFSNAPITYGVDGALIARAMELDKKYRSTEELSKARIKNHSRNILADTFGADKGRTNSFTERERGEDR